MGNVELMRDLYGAFGRGEIPAVVGGMDPNIEWREAEGNPYQPSGGAWRGRYTGTYKETDKELDAQMYHVWKVRDGKATSSQQFVDAAQMQEVMGAL